MRNREWGVPDTGDSMGKSWGKPELGMFVEKRASVCGVECTRGMLLEMTAEWQPRAMLGRPPVLVKSFHFILSVLRINWNEVL